MKEIRRRRLARRRRTRSRVRGTAERPRLSVFRSNRHIAAQLIDDAAGSTLVSASDLAAADGGRPRRRGRALAPGRMERAGRVGEELARRAQAQGIRQARLDRGSYRYHGLVRALAEGARRGGLEF